MLCRNADSHIENGSDYDSDDNLSAVRFFPTLLVPEVDKILRTAGSWQFNAFKLKEATNDAPLSTLVFWLLQTSGLVREFGEFWRSIVFMRKAMRSGSRLSCLCKFPSGGLKLYLLYVPTIIKSKPAPEHE